MTTYYNVAEIALHCTPGDLWVMVRRNGTNLVLDLSTFSHPGGSDVLLDVAGKDATKRIEQVHPHVLDYIDAYCIGQVAPLDF